MSLSQKVQEIEEFMQFKRILTVDEIFDFIDSIEDDELMESLTEQELATITRFVIFLARNGVLPNDQCDEYHLENDIDELLNSNASSAQKTSFSLYGNGAVISCKKEKKNWFSKQWKQTKKFVKKNKKGIIIGTVVVAAAAVVVVGVVVASSATVAAAGSAGTAIADKLQEDKRQPSKERSASSSEESTTSETSVLEEMIQEQSSMLKEDISQNLLMEDLKDSSFGENIKEFGAHLAHETFDAAADLVSVVPEFIEEVKEVGEQILPQIINTDNLEIASSKERYDTLVKNGHETIDQVFSTNQSDIYTRSNSDGFAKEFIDDEFSYGILPPPGSIPKVFFNTNRLIEAGNAIDRAGFTRVGRGLMKHGYREGTLFPKPFGNPTQINKQGEAFLKEILNDSKRTVLKNNRGGIEIYSQSGRGAYFREDGTFRGFIEYGYE